MMSKHITTFFELAIVVVLFITALGYGLTTISMTQLGVQQVTSSNQAKDKNVDLQVSLPVDNSWYGSDLIGFLHTKQLEATNVQIDQTRLSIPIMDKESVDLSFIQANARYQMVIARDQSGKMIEIWFERE